LSHPQPSRPPISSIAFSHNYFNERWADSLDANRKNATSIAINNTGSDPQDYTTSQVRMLLLLLLLYWPMKPLYILY
jgi:hypothetical protein